jgi:hypothetical protein
MAEDITTTASAPTSLSWMPIFVDDLLSLSATLSPAQLGGLMRLRAYAWRQSPPATLPDSDARLATISGLTATWAEDGPVLRELFTPIGDMGEGKRLLDPWLDKVWQQQFAKYVSASLRGKKGGRPKAENKAELSAGSGHIKQPEKLGLNSALAELRSTLSSELHSTSGIQSSEETKAGGKLSFSGQREAVDPYRAADEAVNSEAARRDAHARSIVEQYEADLETEVERFRESRPADYEAHRIEAIKSLGFFGRELSERAQQMVDASTAERIRVDQEWPSKATYMANHGRPAPTIASVSREKVPA